MYEPCRNIARVVKAHGRNGEVVAVSASGLPPYLRKGLEVAVVPPPERGERWHVVERVEGDPAGVLVRLSGVRDIGAAQALAGTWLLARVKDLPSDLPRHDAAQLVGRDVEDAVLGAIGTISEVMFGPANDVWVVEGPLGEVLVPVTNEVVPEVAPEGPISVSLPAGSVAGEGERP